MSGLTTRFGRAAAVAVALLLVLGSMLTAAPALASASSTVDRLNASAGDTLVVKASGFSDEEEVISWATRADGATYATARGYADASGKISLSVTSGRFWAAGWYAITLHGVASGTETTARVQIAAVAPDSQLDVSAASAVAGDDLSFHGSGFSDADAINVWITAPDGTASAVAADLVSTNGEVWFTYAVPADAAAGTYYMTAYGQTTEHLEIVAFHVTL